MPENHSSNISGDIFRPKPLRMFLITVAAIFFAEALVMVILPNLELQNIYVIAFVDAVSLCVIVVPALYLFLFKPMRQSILSLDQSEKIQKQLEEIDQLKSDFISIAGHELCTPVSTISGYVDLLLAGVSAEQQEKYLKVIQGRTVALERIIDDLQVVNHLEAGESLQIIKTENDLSKTVSHVVNVYKTRFPDKSFHIKVPEQPLLIEYDEIRISQVLDNLLSNAVKYENDIQDELEISVVDQVDQVLIQVRDEGIGMTPEELKQIYKKFFRAETEKSLVGGLGLGMAIVKNIVEGHGGSIDIISQRKVGTTVSVKLPKTTA